MNNKPKATPFRNKMVSTHLLSTPCLYFCFANKTIYTIFSRFHIYVLISDTCFSLPDLLHSLTLSCMDTKGERGVGRIGRLGLTYIHY